MDLFTPGHLVVIAVVAVVFLIGWKRLPEMSRSLGRSLRIFKTEMKAMDTDVRDAVTPAPSTPVADAITAGTAAHAEPAEPTR